MAARVAARVAALAVFIDELGNPTAAKPNSDCS